MRTFEKLSMLLTSNSVAWANELSAFATMFCLAIDSHLAIPSIQMKITFQSIVFASLASSR